MENRASAGDRLGPAIPLAARLGPAALWLAAAALAVVAVHRIGFAMTHAVSDVTHWSAVNAAFRHDEVVRWFSGRSIFHEGFGRQAYPPATYVLLWPILGWLPYATGRLLYAGATLSAAAVLGLIAYKAAPAHPVRNRLLLVLVLFASYPLQAAVFLGHLLPIQGVALVAAAATLLARTPGRMWRDLAASALLAASLSKPTLAPPLVAAVLIGHWRWRPTLLTGVIYGGLAVFASAFQPAGPVALHADWLRSSVSYGVQHSMAQGVPNLHGFLKVLGLGAWAPIASIVALVAFCLWLWRRRDVDIWVLIGAAALVARLWAHHRPYDDIVVFLAVVALLRVARGSVRRLRLPATLLLVAACAALLTPAWAIYDLAPETIRLIFAAQTTLWVALLVFLTTARAGHTTGPGLSFESRAQAVEPAGIEPDDVR
jgi:hypothetical protein